ncbi:MurR/RpiR family transcriptional regulator [Pelagibius sp. CAU 1746]|uniref:MurR/RpiR family transcriptional regulator n=1 Tax=Pelagibius sp. CAU 1746 TaxID=3140370 RepID=UPI00325B44E3
MQSFKEIVEAYEGRLTEADRTLVGIILGDPGSVVFQSAGELAARADVHASTVVRLAHKLGFEGYLDLRKVLRRESSIVSGQDDRIRRRLDRIDRGSNLIRLIDSEIAALAAIPEKLSQEDIDEAADVLAAAGTIYLVGRGSAVPLATHLDRRLRRAGFRTAVAVNLQQRDLVEHLIGLREGDAVIGFAFQSLASLPAGYSALLRHIRRVGAKSVVVSDSLGPTLRPRPDKLLSVSRPDEGEMALRTGPMLVCEALAMTLAHKDPERAVAGLESLEQLRAEFENDEGQP